MFQKIRFNKMSASTITETILLFWLRRYKAIFFIVFFGICATGISLWYYSLYYFEWSDEQKSAYTDSQSHAITLNKKHFEEVLQVIEHRNSMYQSWPDPVKDIFATKKEKVKE